MNKELSIIFMRITLANRRQLKKLKIDKEKIL
jgi:hypothetical protein